MDLDSPFALITLFGTILLALFGIGSYNNNLDNQAITALVKQGTSPLEARCVIRPNDKEKECFLLFLKKDSK